MEKEGLIPEHSDDFRRILELAPEAPLPEGLVKLYREYKRRIDICSAGALTPKELTLLVTLYEAREPRPTYRSPEKKKPKGKGEESSSEKEKEQKGAFE